MKNDFAARTTLFLLCLTLLSTTVKGQSWLWAQQIEGPDKDEILGITSDYQGNVYVCGRYQDTIRFSSSTFFTGTASYYNGFIAKYDSSGTFLWARNFGGNNHDYASAICTDDSGFVYVACYGRSSTPITFDAFSYTGTGNDKTFLLKINPSGSLVWGKLLTAGTSNAYPTSIAVNNGMVAIAGNYAFLNLIIESDTLFHWGADDIFVATYGAVSGNLLWTKALKSQFQDYANDVVVDDSGNVYLAGIFNSTLSVGAVDTLYTPYGYEVFLCKFDQSGQYQWSRRYNGTGDHQVDAIRIDGSGNVYIAGWHGSGNHILNDTTFTMLYSYNFFLQKVSPVGNSLWTRHFHGGSLGRIIGMAMDPLDQVILSGYLGSMFLFDTIQVVGYSSDYRMFLAKVDGYGNVLEAIDGGNRVNNSGFNNVTADPFGNVYAVGWFGSASGHQCVFGDDTLISKGESDGYIVKYGIEGGTPCIVHAGFLYPGSGLCEGDSVQLVNTSLNASAYKWLLNGIEISLVEHPLLQMPASGHFTITLIASGAGCFDTVHHAVVIHPNWLRDIYDTICQGDEYLFDGVLLNQAGTYLSHHQSSAGCDSTEVLHLAVDPFSINFWVAGDSAVASSGATTYAWLNCDLGMAAIPGAIDPYFVPEASGNYAVVASNGRCTDTTACQYILVITVKSLSANSEDISVYPVPSNDFVAFRNLTQTFKGKAGVYDFQGRLLMMAPVVPENPALNIAHLPPGQYLITLTTEGRPLNQWTIIKR